MKFTDKELQVIEDLHLYGTPLDATFLEDAKAAWRGLEITQTGDCPENAIHAQPSGGIGLMVSIALENLSIRVISIRAVRLKIPGIDTDFHWLKRLSSKEVCEFGGYTLPASGPCEFDPAIVLNHRFTRGFKLYPEEQIEGFLLGEGTASIPDDYPNRALIPVQLVIYDGNDRSHRAWLKLTLYRDGQRRNRELAGKQLQPKNKPRARLM